MRSVDIVAHRGAAAVAPENTPAGFEIARATDVRYIEVDVQLTVDGVPVLVHDTTLTRTTDVERVFGDRESHAVGAFTWEELQQLDAGSWYHEDFTGERIPRLEQLIEYADSGVGICVELKDPALSPGVEQMVADVIRGDDRWLALLECDGLAVSSFDLDALAKFHDVAPEVPVIGTGDLPNDAILTEASTWMTSWTTNYRRLGDDAVRRIHDRGMECIVYTVNSPDHMVAVAEIGVDGIITDAPHVLQRLLSGSDAFPNANGVMVTGVVTNEEKHVVLENTSKRTVDVDGWFMLDALANRLNIGPGYVIPPDGTLQVFAGPGTNTPAQYYNDLGRDVLDDRGGSIAVFTPDRTLIDLYAY